MATHSSGRPETSTWPSHASRPMKNVYKQKILPYMRADEESGAAGARPQGKPQGNWSFAAIYFLIVFCVLSRYSSIFHTLGNEEEEGARAFIKRVKEKVVAGPENGVNMCNALFFAPTLGSISSRSLGGGREKGTSTVRGGGGN